MGTFAAVTGGADERTGTLVVPVAGYAALDAGALTAALLFFLSACGRR